MSNDNLDKKNEQYKKYRKSGSSILELCFGLIFLVPLVLYSFDFALILFTLSKTNNLAYTFCRAASFGMPANLSNVHTSKIVSINEEPFKRVKTELENVLKSNEKYSLDLHLTESIYNPLPSAPVGGPVHGDVTVLVDFSFPLPFALPGIPSNVHFQSKQTMPYTWTMPTTVVGLLHND